MEPTLGVGLREESVRTELTVVLFHVTGADPGLYSRCTGGGKCLFTIKAFLFLA